LSCFETIRLRKTFLIILLFAFPVFLFTQEVYKRNKSADSNLSVSNLLLPHTVILSEPKLRLDTLKESLMTKNMKILYMQTEAYREAFKGLKNDFNKIISNPFSLDKGAISVTGQSDNYTADSFQTRHYNLFDAYLNGSIIGIPFSAFYQNNYYPFVPDGNLNRMGFQYDRQAYLNSIKKKLSGKFNPEDLLNDIGDPVQMLKSAAAKSLHDELSNLKSKYKGLIDDKVNQLGDLKELILKDPAAIRKALLDPKLLKQLKIKSELLSQLQNQINTGGKIDMQEFEGLKNDLLKYQGTEALMKTL